MTLSTALPLPAADLLATVLRVRPADDATARRTGAVALAAALAANATAWADLVEYRPAGRWTHRLEPAAAAAVLDPSLHADLDAAEVWLLSWLPGQGTPLHDHGGSAGAFAVVQGALTELTVTAPRSGGVRDATALFSAGRVRPFGPHHVHRVTNDGARPAVSVHVYTPRLREMTTYRLAGQGLVRTGTERAGTDW